MSFEKMSSIEERKVLRLIEKAVYHSRGGMTPTDAMCKAAETVAVTPELMKRACEAFNKSKSVYMLSSTPSDRRAETFPLVDADEVVARVYTRTARSDRRPAAIPAADYSELGLPFFKAAMEKSVSDDKDKPAELGSFDARRKIFEARDRSYLIKNAASRIRQLRIESEMSLDKALEAMGTMNVRELEKTARMVYNRYGEDGKALMEIAAAKLHKKFGIEKTASYSVFPYREPFISIVKAMEKAAEYRRLKKNFFLKQADLKSGITADVINAVKLPVNIVSQYASPIVELSKVPIVEYLTKERDVGAKGLDETLDPDTLNSLKAIDASQNFIDVASDPHLRNYSVNQIADAYNSVIGVMPELQKPRYKAWLSSLVRKQLVQGDTFDPNEIPTLASAAGSLARRESDAAKAAEGAVQAVKEEVSKKQALLPEGAAEVIAGLGRGLSEKMDLSETRTGGGGGSERKGAGKSGDARGARANIPRIAEATPDQRKVMLEAGIIEFTDNYYNKRKVPPAARAEYVPQSVDFEMPENFRYVPAHELRSAIQTYQILTPD